MSDGEHAGPVLRLLRLYARMSPEEVATAAQTSVGYLLAVEEGALPVSRTFVRHIADVIAGRLVASEAPGQTARSPQPPPSPEERAEPA